MTTTNVYVLQFATEIDGKERFEGSQGVFDSAKKAEDYLLSLLCIVPLGFTTCKPAEDMLVGKHCWRHDGMLCVEIPPDHQNKTLSYWIEEVSFMN